MAEAARAEESQGPAGASALGKSRSSARDPSSPAFLYKWQRVLHALLGGRSFNRFEAAHELRDWCLHSTVAGLEKRGLVIERKAEVVGGAFGPVHCCRYWLAKDSKPLACAVLGTATPRATL
ncbi:MAG TPA: hypothetical protein VFC18_05220 [Burkholderiales bacterium]|nr:hypothetical protein [Burkholderiales bacterium]